MVVQIGEENSAVISYSSFSLPRGGCKKVGEGLFAVVWSDKIMGNVFKLKEGSFRLNTRN